MDPLTHDPASTATGDAGRDRDARVQALLHHARALVGVPLADIADGHGLPVPVGTVSTKGWSGQIIERELATTEKTQDENRERADDPGGSAHRAGGPDFADLGIELKTVPVDLRGRPLESTAVCAIDPIAIAGESWETSYVRRKLTRVLFIALEAVAPGPGGRPVRLPVGERVVSAATLWVPSPREEMVLRADFQHVVRDYFRTGRADQLTGHVGVALQVRPKGASSRDRRTAYDAKGDPVHIGRCGFYLRPTFVAHILKGHEPGPL